MYPILILSKEPFLVEAFHGFSQLFQMNNALQYATTTSSFQIHSIYHIYISIRRELFSYYIIWKTEVPDSDTQG